MLSQVSKGIVDSTEMQTHFVTHIHVCKRDPPPSEKVQNYKLLDNTNVKQSITWKSKWGLHKEHGVCNQPGHIYWNGITHSNAVTKAAYRGKMLNF